MGNVTLSESLRSLLEHARNALASTRPHSRPATEPISESYSKAAIKEPEPALELRQSRRFTDGVVVVKATVGLLGGEGDKQVQYPVTIPDGNDVTLDIATGTDPATHNLRITVAGIRRFREFLNSNAGGEMLAWLQPAPPVVSHPPPISAQVSAESPRTGDFTLEISRFGYGQLLQWAKQHRDDATALEAAYDLFQRNLPRWRQVSDRDWRGPKNFEKVRRRAERLRAQSAAEAAARENAVFQQELNRYEALVRGAHENWGDAARLIEVVAELRRNLAMWSALFPVTWQGRIEIDRITARAAELHVQADAGAGIVQPGEQKSQSVSQRKGGSPPGVPEWPREAKAIQAVALAGDQFSYTSGVLSYMGYRVGKVSTLTLERRRKILEYVLLGALPQVNDRQYMRTWGRPKTTVRLRKLANAVATFARNARRKRKANMGQAIKDWEADLAYLKKRYYERRSRDWKWPVTVRSGRR